MLQCYACLSSVCLVVCNVCVVAKRCVLPKICLKKQIGNGPWESNGHVTNDVTWPRKVIVVIPIRLGPSISKTAGDAIYNTIALLWGITVGYPSNSLALVKPLTGFGGYLRNETFCLFLKISRLFHFYTVRVLRNLLPPSSVASQNYKFPFTSAQVHNLKHNDNRFHLKDKSYIQRMLCLNFYWHR